MTDLDIASFQQHGINDQSPLQFITTNKLACYERVAKAILAVDAANNELRAAMTALAENGKA